MKLPLHRLWLCAASVALALGLLVLALSMVQGAGSLTRITIASDSNRYSYAPSLNADGTRIAFESTSDFFGQGIPQFQYEIWLYDTKTMTLTRITTAVDDERGSVEAHLNADGTKISFNSESDFLNQGISNDQFEAWLYDTTAMTLTRITTASHSDRDSFAQSISADGTKIALYGDSDFLGQGIRRWQYEIWLYDTTTMTLTRVTTAAGGGLSNRQSLRPSLNADGTKVVFDSDSDFFNQGIPSSQHEIWLYNTASMTLTRVTTASASDRSSAGACLDADGTRITFSSDADFFSQGIPNDQFEVWLYNAVSMTLTRVTTASDSNRNSSFPSISADGTKIAFVSDSDFLDQGIVDDHYELWLYDTTTLSLTRVTTTTNNNFPFSFLPSLNADGTKIAFYSDSDFLNQSIPIGQNEIWLYGESNQNGVGHNVYLPVLLKQAP